MLFFTQRPDKEIEFPRARVTGLSLLTWMSGCSEQILSPLGEQEALLPTEPSLQPDQCFNMKEQMIVLLNYLMLAHTYINFKLPRFLISATPFSNKHSLTLNITSFRLMLENVNL